jgi:hypothetical protein
MKSHVRHCDQEEENFFSSYRILIPDRFLECRMNLVLAQPQTYGKFSTHFHINGTFYAIVCYCKNN